MENTKQEDNLNVIKQNTMGNNDITYKNHVNYNIDNNIDKNVNKIIVGKIIAGDSNYVIIRIKRESDVSIGEILSLKQNNKVFLFYVSELRYSSQIQQSHLEMISGLVLENENFSYELYDENIRNYLLGILKPMITIDLITKQVKTTKKLPNFFGNVYKLNETYLNFLNKDNGFFTGYLRSGDSVFENIKIKIPFETINHHIFVAAKTGSGKSNLVKVLLSNYLINDIPALILDPHDEYFGRKGFGLKDINSKLLKYKSKDNLLYFTSNTNDVKAESLFINFKDIKPSHVESAINLSEAQREVLYLIHRIAKKQDTSFVELLIKSDLDELNEMINSRNISSLSVLKRKIMKLLDIDDNLNHYIFKDNISSINKIINAIKNKKVVIIDTSNLSNDTEILIGSIIAERLFYDYKKNKNKNYPKFSIVIEEAPRVIGKDKIQKTNIFETIAREGRKFGIGLIAITQLPSLIPKEILANMNTKVILGIEMKSERNYIIESSAQDLSDLSNSIASLDKGEAIVSSVFTKFAIPIKIPLFKELNFEDLGLKLNNSIKQNLSF